MRNGRKPATKGVKNPMVAGDHGNPGHRIFTKRAVFRPFWCFELFGPDDFPKIWFSDHEICRSPSTSQIHRRNHMIVIRRFEIANQPTKKAHFLSDWSRNRLDRCCQPIGINQCLKLHRHPTSKNMWIHRRSSQEEFQKTRHGPRFFERLGDHLMQLNDPFYDKLMRLLTHYFRQLNQKQGKRSYKFK